MNESQMRKIEVEEDMRIEINVKLKCLCLEALVVGHFPPCLRLSTLPMSTIVVVDQNTCLKRILLHRSTRLV